MTEKLFLKDGNFLRILYNNFDPYTPLPAGHPAYVNCQEVRGDENIIQQIGRRILLSDKSTCQLYTGHRGGGKSTELYRLKDYLEKKGCFVVYFNCDEDLDLENVGYPDILLACTRHIVDELKNSIQSNALIPWLEEKGQELRSFGSSDTEITSFSIGVLFAKIVANVKNSPNNRTIIRKQLEDNIVTFTQALNEFIEEAKKKLPNEKNKLVVIADSLDRIPIKRNSDGSNNHDEIFIDHNVQLRSLNCHVVYTVPISLVYSNRAASLNLHYGSTEVLPMIMIQDRTEKIKEDGINKIKTIMGCRLKFVIYKWNLSKNISQKITPNLKDIFDHEDTLNRLCQITGGHLREVMFLVQESISVTGTLPITRKAVERAIATSRNTYNSTVDHIDWQKLAEVARDKKIINDEEYRNLLFNRCVLEYRDVEDQRSWYDVHPLIKEIDEFKQACEKLKDNEHNNP